MAESEINFENVEEKDTLLQEYERLPLKQRLKLLLANRRISFESNDKSETEIPVLTPNLGDAMVEKIKLEHDESEDGDSTKEQMIEVLREGQAVNFEPELSDEFLDELDDVPLKDRLIRLLKSKSLDLMDKTIEGDSSGISSLVSESIHHQQTSSGELTFGDQKLSVCGNQNYEIDKTLKFVSSKGEELPGIQRTDEKKYDESIGLNIAANIIKVQPPICNVITSGHMKKEFEFPNIHSHEDDELLDHMSLGQRIKLLPPIRMNILHQGSECMKKREPIQLLKLNRRRKKRKTVTDSIETAMEEDAPGLLQVLIEKGVSVNEIKLYGEPESSDALDDSSANDDFAELEEVIAKLFSRRESLLKFAPLRCGKEEKASYCLACLFKLVEQARYLQFRHWPVEWGWCRDLQSFIFVFERHHRIVLERPEYGYATYFFQLEDSVTIKWQIRRLVTAMKLTNCSRVTLIENKPLVVGDDLSEGEARVLMEYGWIPNTGLGTMLNYYDRVVHDRRNEKDSSSDWSCKIGKLLTDGYNGGTIISDRISKKFTEQNVNPMEIKIELD